MKKLLDKLQTAYFNKEIKGNVKSGKIKKLKMKQPEVRSYGKQYIELLEDYTFKIKGFTPFRIRKGFIWDIASISKLAFTLPQGKEPGMIVPSLGHDYCFRFGIMSFRKSNDFFYQLCLKAGYSKWKSWRMRMWLNIGSKSIYNSYKIKGYHINSKNRVV